MSDHEISALIKSSFNENSGFLSELKSKDESIVLKSNKSISEDNNDINNLRFSYDLYG
jgi:hypothetical protein